MNRLPINLLLYVAILGLLGGSGWHFYQAFLEKKGPDQQAKDREAYRDRFVKTLAKGSDAAGKVVVGPNYAQPQDYWNSFRDVNFIGKEPPPPPTQINPNDTPPQPVEKPQTPLEDILVVQMIVSGGADSRVLVRYKPSANVEPPPDAVPPAPGFDSVPLPNAGPTRRPPIPTFGDGLGPAQDVLIDQTLWKPYDNIRLVRVLDDAAVFVREDAKVAKEEWKEEMIFPEVLELSQDVLRKLRDGLGVQTTPGEARAVAGDNEPVQSSGWQAFELTTEVGENRFNIGTRDRDLFGNDPERVFSDDIGTADWRSPSNSLRGVRITKLAPGYERYGIQRGEIIIAINGESVGSKSEAIKTGKSQYRRGVRTFTVDFLTQNGGTISRTYVAPDRD